MLIWLSLLLIVSVVDGTVLNGTIQSKSVSDGDTSHYCAGATNLEHLKGYCMFHYECLQKRGVSIGTCFEENIVGSCCMLSETAGLEIQSKHISTNNAHNKLTSLLLNKRRKPFFPHLYHQQKNPTVLNNSLRWSLLLSGGSSGGGGALGPTTSSTVKVNTVPVDEFNYYEIISANNRQTTNKQTVATVAPSTIVPMGNVSTNEPPIDMFDTEVDDGIDTVTTEVVSTTTTTTTVLTTNAGSSEPEKPKCGLRVLHPTGRVVGGRNSQFGEWPWQVLIKESTWLGFFMKVKCGGVLISHKWVLTAAHCQPGMMGSLVVMLGQHELNGYSQHLKPVVRTVRRMIVHRDYNPDTFENDIALLELDTPYNAEQTHIMPICLPEQDEDYVSKYAYVTGWGKLSYGGLMPSILQTVRLPIIANKVCQKMFADAGHYKSIRDSFLCAGYPQGGKDTCEGDSGGPLMVSKNGVWSLIGTVSHGIKCAEPNMPGVYMKTYAYLNWINGITGRW